MVELVKTRSRKEVPSRSETPTEESIIEERVEVARRHLEMSVAWKGEVLGVLETRRHYTNYFKGYENFKPYRTRMVTSNSSS